MEVISLILHLEKNQKSCISLQRPPDYLCKNSCRRDLQIEESHSTELILKYKRAELVATYLETAHNQVEILAFGYSCLSKFFQQEEKLLDQLLQICIDRRQREL